MIEKKAVYHIQVFSGVEHGFAVRGDPAHEHAGKRLLKRLCVSIPIFIGPRRTTRGGCWNGSSDSRTRLGKPT